MLRVEMTEVLRQNLELRQQIELHLLRQRRHLSRAQLVENDLKHSRKVTCGVWRGTSESLSHQIVKLLNQTNIRFTRWPILVVISHVIVLAFSANSTHGISASPCLPINTISSPRSTSGMCETSITIRSIVTRPSNGQRFPLTNISALTFDKCRG